MDGRRTHGDRVGGAEIYRVLVTHTRDRYLSLALDEENGGVTDFGPVQRGPSDRSHILRLLQRFPESPSEPMIVTL